MGSSLAWYYDNYSPVGDILVMTVCLVFIILIHTAYINRTRNFMLLRYMIEILFMAALCDVVYHMMMNHVGEVPNLAIYLVRYLFCVGLFLILFLTIMYMRESLHLEPRMNLRLHIIGGAILVTVAVLQIFGTIMHFGFYIDRDGIAHAGLPIFTIAYFIYVGMIVVVLFRFRDRVYRPVVNGVAFTVGLSLAVMILQQVFHQSSYTAASYLFPIYALLYLAHANPYDLETGSVGESAFEDLIRNSYEQKEELLIMSLFLPEFDISGKKYPVEIQKAVRFFSSSFFRGASLFQLSNGLMALVADTAKNADYIAKSQKMLDAFAEHYPKYRHDYKIVFSKTWNKISAENDYAGLIRYMHEQMPLNSFRRVEDKDIRKYLEHKFILRALADITAQGDMFDQRVEVYCQPVYNLRTGSYDTAEALMRLRLPEYGLVSPELFIPAAENHKYIYMLTRIILNKTCTQIRQMTQAGYRVKRISVNVSVFDLWEPDFTSEVERIIRDSGASAEQLAIEITESQNEKDFAVIKERVDELKGSGIKFYLDDFGTGYSNFERIMELPFDIIKFDRSMVAASRSDEKVKDMVSHLARMFSDMDYAVLYEGVETEEDEACCIGMSAKYLQGYKYTKPIPIERLTEYFEKRA